MFDSEKCKFGAKTLKADEAVSGVIQREGMKSLQPKFAFCSSKRVFQRFHIIGLLTITSLLLSGCFEKNFTYTVYMGESETTKNEPKTGMVEIMCRDKKEYVVPVPLETDKKMKPNEMIKKTLESLFQIKENPYNGYKNPIALSRLTVEDIIAPDDETSSVYVNIKGEIKFGPEDKCGKKIAKSQIVESVRNIIGTRKFAIKLNGNLANFEKAFE